MFVYVSIYMYVYAHTYVYVSIYMYVYAHIYVYVSIYMYVYAHIYVQDTVISDLKDEYSVKSVLSVPLLPEV